MARHAQPTGSRHEQSARRPEAFRPDAGPRPARRETAYAREAVRAHQAAQAHEAGRAHEAGATRVLPPMPPVRDISTNRVLNPSHEEQPADRAPALPVATSGRGDRRARGRGTRRTGASRRGGRLHGALIYATGTLLVLSMVYGVASTVGDGDNVITNSAASFRSLLFGDHGVKHRGWSATPNRHGRQAPRSTVAAGPTAPAPQPSAAPDTTPPPAVDTGSKPPPPASPTADTKPSPSGTTTQAPATGATTQSSVPAGTWLSGASGDDVTNGKFGAWRGTPVAIAGTWADNNDAQVQLWQLKSGGDLGSWDKPVDIAIGAIGDGESWAQAAQGAYDQRWTQSLTNMKNAWGSRKATVYIRFAHEMNGNWYPWSVNSGNYQDFMTAWKRFRALQQQIFPASKLVFCVNRESVGTGMDWRKFFPGAQNVDVLGVDYYNQFPYVSSQSDWDSSVNQTDGYGAPKGLAAHLAFAKSVGLPLGVPEWSGNADQGDSPAYVKAMHDFFSSHAGGGAGQLLYDIQFNIDKDNTNWTFYGNTRMPASAKEYQSAF